MRFLPEIDEHERMALRASRKQFGAQGRRLVQYSTEPMEAPAQGDAAIRLVRVLIELDRRRIAEVNPEFASDYGLLTSSALSLDTARQFLGRPLSRLFDGVSFSARVTGVVTGQLGHLAFDVLYEDGDTAQLTPLQLAQSMTWEITNVAFPVLQRNRGGAARPRPVQQPAAAPSAAATPVCPGQADEPRLAPRRPPVLLAVHQDYMYAAALHAGRLQAQLRRRAGLDSTIKARPSPPAAPPTATKADYVPWRVDKKVYGDLHAAVLKGLDTQLQDE